jgi:hypothetical protein
VDKGKEVHADAHLGETMGALRECFEPHRRRSAFSTIDEVNGSQKCLQSSV